MRTNQLQKVAISQTALEWLKANYEAVDNRDGELYEKFLADDCRLCFGNNPVSLGKQEIIQGITQFWNAINGLDHSFIHVLGNDFHFAAEAKIDYIRKDNKVVTIPCVTIIERNADGLASFIRIFIDTTPIFSN